MVSEGLAKITKYDEPHVGVAETLFSKSNKISRIEQSIYR